MTLEGKSTSLVIDYNNLALGQQVQTKSVLGKGMRIKTILVSYVTGGAILSEVIIFRQEHRESSYNQLSSYNLAMPD